MIADWKDSINGIDTLYYAVTDNLGSVTEVQAATGTTLWESEYLAFGKVAGVLGDLPFDGFFTGKDLDADTGLRYYWNRWTSPDGSRFMSEDPARDGVNWYGYCGGNPVDFTDPSGLETGVLQQALIHMGVYFGNDEDGFTVYEYKGYDEDSSSEYLGLEPIGFPSAEIAEKIVTLDQGMSGIKVTKLANRGDLNDFISKDFRPENTVVFDTEVDQENKMIDNIKNELTNNESENYIGQYDLGKNNCGVFVGNVLRSGGLEVPDKFNVPIIADIQMLVGQFIKNEIKDFATNLVSIYENINNILGAINYLTEE